MSQSLIPIDQKLQSARLLEMTFEYECSTDSEISVSVSHGGSANPSSKSVSKGKGTVEFATTITKPSGHDGPVTVTFKLGGAYHDAYV